MEIMHSEFGRIEVVVSARSCRIRYKWGEMGLVMYVPRLKDVDKGMAYINENTDKFVRFIEKAKRMQEGARIIKKEDKKAILERAKAQLPLRIAALAQEHGLEFASVEVKFFKSCWGNCSRDKRIKLSAFLVLLDQELVDYVIIHELCHTKHLNHSAQFWQAVENMLPDYKLRRKELKTIVIKEA